MQIRLQYVSSVREAFDDSAVCRLFERCAYTGRVHARRKERRQIDCKMGGIRGRRRQGKEAAWNLFGGVAESRGFFGAVNTRLTLY